MANDGGVSFFVWGFMLGDAEFDSSIGGSRHDFVDKKSIHLAEILIYVIPDALGAALLDQNSGNHPPIHDCMRHAHTPTNQTSPSSNPGACSHHDHHHRLNAISHES